MSHYGIFFVSNVISAWSSILYICFVLAKNLSSLFINADFSTNLMLLSMGASWKEL